MSGSKLKVAILGAGACGLVAVKCCLDEDLDPVCFERTDHIGGLWYYSDDVTSGQASVAKTTIVNTSKEIMSYSDFPAPKEFPNFMHNTKVVEYFRAYAENFDLLRYVQFNTEVEHVTKADNFEDTGQWLLTIRNKSTGREWTQVFDAVMLCTGHHADKHVPHFDGIDVFQGKILHTNEFRDHRGFEDKTVVVVGIGNSGGDAAVDLSRIAKQVFISTRRGTWVCKRLGPGGLPFDCTSFSRFAYDFLSLLPEGLKNSLVESAVNRQLDHEMYNLKPEHGFFAQHPMCNDDLANRLASGTIVIKPDIKRFLETAVEFVDGSVAEDVDVVLLATGYVFGFPYLEEGIVDVTENKVDLYKYVFPPELGKPTLACIGFVQQLGAINPIAEMQARWATRIFKKVEDLPSKEKLLADIHKKKEVMAKRYISSQRHTIQVDGLPYMDEIAEMIGCKPNIGRMFWKDFKLAWSVYFGPVSPYQYRLDGPGKWKGAREAIVGQWDRITFPLNQGLKRDEEGSNFSWSLMWKVALLVMIMAWLLTALRS